MKTVSSMVLQVDPLQELGIALRLLADGKQSETNLQAATGNKKGGQSLHFAGMWFDNLIVKRSTDGDERVYSARYIEVMPETAGDGWLLRVKPSSTLGRALRCLLDADGYVDEQALAEAAGKQYIKYAIKLADRWFINLDVVAQKGADGWEYTARYRDLSENKVVVVEAGGEALPAAQTPEITEVKLLWPEAPAVPSKMGNYDKTSEHEEVAWALGKGKHVMMESPPSVGKDTLIEQVACEMGMPLATVGADMGLRREHLEGTQEMVNGTSFFKVSDYAAAAVHGWWVAVPEVNAADPGVAVYMNPQLDDKQVISIHGHNYRVHPDFRVVCSYNAGLPGTRPINDAFKDRFWPVKMKWFTHKQLRRRLEKWGLPTVDDNDAEWGEMIVQFGMDMRRAFEDGELRYHISVRRLIDAIDYRLDHPDADIKAVLRKAVLETIDAAMDIKAAEKVLRNVTANFSQYYGTEEL